MPPHKPWAAGMGSCTILRFEHGDPSIRETTIIRIRLAFERAGVEFTNGKRPGVRVAMTATRGRCWRLT